MAYRGNLQTEHNQTGPQNKTRCGFTVISIRIGMVTTLNEIESLAITGANGFVGKSVIKYLSSQDKNFLPDRIILITRSGLNYALPSSLESKIEILEQDLTKEWKFKSNFTHLLNFAADGTRDPYSEEANQVFTSICRNLANYLEHLPDFKRLFHASTGACAGIFSIEDSTSSANEKTDFIRNRLQGEDFLISHAETNGYEITIGRLFTFSGTFILEKKQYAITSFIESALRTGKIYINGDPNTTRSYLHQDAMSEWILATILSDVPHRILQIGSNERVSMQELAEMVAAITSAEIVYNRDHSPGNVYIPRNSRTSTLLNVDEGLHWRQAVIEMVSHFRMEQNGKP